MATKPQSARPAPAQAQEQTWLPDPAVRAAFSPRAMILALSKLHGGAGHHHRQCSRSRIFSGNLGIFRSTRAAWVITSYAVAEAICVSVDRLAVAALSRGALLHDGDGGVRDILRSSAAVR